MSRSKPSLWKTLVAGAAALLSTIPSPAQDVNYQYYYNTPAMSAIGTHSPYGNFDASRIGRYGLSEFNTPFSSGFSAVGPGFMFSYGSTPFGTTAGIFGRNGGLVLSAPGYSSMFPLPPPRYGYPAGYSPYNPLGPSPMTQGFAQRFRGQSVQPLTGVPLEGRVNHQIPSRGQKPSSSPSLPQEPSKEQPPVLQPVSPSHPSQPSISSLSDLLQGASAEYTSKDRPPARRWHIYAVASLPDQYKDELEGFPLPEFLAISHEGNPDLPGARKFPIYVDPSLDELERTGGIAAVYLPLNPTGAQIKHSLAPVIAKIDALLPSQ